MKLSPKKLFLIDCLGACLSAFLLGVVLTTYEETFGMPRNVLYILAGLACMFAIYSFVNFIWFRENWRPFMKAIALTNLLYCVLTIGLMIYFWENLTNLGIGYFVLECLVIIGLVGIEFKSTQ